MKEVLLFVAVMACVGLIASIFTVQFMVNTIPSTNPSQGNLFNNSIKSTVSYLTIPALFLLGLGFLAFLVFLLRMRRG